MRERVLAAAPVVALRGPPSAAANAVIPISPNPGTSPDVINNYQLVTFPPNDDGTWPCGGTGNAPPACPGPSGQTGPTAVSLGFNINFFGTNFSSVYVNNNGNVTFSAPLPAFTPSDLTTFGSPIIAPFFADVDTRAGSGLANFGTGTLNGQKVFVVQWPGVGCFDQTTSVLNNFQMVLIDRPDLGTNALGDDFVMEFNYNSIQWDAGQHSSGDSNCQNASTPGDSAYVGFSNGTSTPGDSYNLPGSGMANVFLDASPTGLISHDLNSATLGRYIFGVVGGQPVLDFNPNGYRLVGNEGGVFDFGLNYNGSLATAHLNAPIVGIANAPGANGYLMAGGDGGVFALGGANFYGSLGGQVIPSPIAAIAATPSEDGYWLAAQDGKLYHYGNGNNFFGAPLPPGAHIVGIASTNDGNGLWLTDQFGHVYARGDAQYMGGADAVRLNAPIVGMAATATGQGYVLVGADGGIYTYGVGFFGSVPGSLAAGQHLLAPIVGIAVTHSGNGYWEVGADGGVFNYGDAPFLGSVHTAIDGTPLNGPIVGVQHLA